MKEEMAGSQPRAVAPQWPAPGACQDISPGHGIGFFQAVRLNSSPELWHNAVITQVDGDGGAECVLIDDGTVRHLRHHAPLTQLVEPGRPVQVNLVHSALYCGPGRVVSVRISDAGPVELRRDCVRLPLE